MAVVHSLNGNFRLIKYLGYPIVNDPVYNDKRLWGENNGKDGLYFNTKKEIEDIFLQIHKRDVYLIDNEVDNADEENGGHSEQNQEANSENLEKRKSESATETSLKKVKYESDKTEASIENHQEATIGVQSPSQSEDYENCEECRNVCRDPLPKELIMYLHALSYKVRRPGSVFL